jgi:hypothetical protein
MLERKEGFFSLFSTELTSNCSVLSSNPIQDATVDTLACNDDGTSSALQLTATVAAGSKITAYWNNPWPHPYGPQVRISSGA